MEFYDLGRSGTGNFSGYTAKADTPVWLHPDRHADFADYKTEDASQFEIFWTFGWPYETSVAMARMVFAGFFDRWPNLKIITHHMGVMIPPLVPKHKRSKSLCQPMV